MEKATEVENTTGTAADPKDHCNYAHAEKVRRYSLALAEVLGLSPDAMDRLSSASLLHDVGKIGVHHDILIKKGALSEEEFEEIKRHPQIAARIIANAHGLGPCVAAIRHHHERYDGTGYPQGLKGEGIPLEARILGLADAFADMTSDRPYRKALPWEEAIHEIRRNAGTQFDPKMALAFVAAIESGIITKPAEDE